MASGICCAIRIAPVPSAPTASTGFSQSAEAASRTAHPGTWTTWTCWSTAEDARYALTAEGADLLQCLAPLNDWATRWAERERQFAKGTSK